jgi:hypothetical protein
LNKEAISIINSYFGHFRHADSFNLRKSIYRKIISQYKKEVAVKGNYFSLKLPK